VAAFLVALAAGACVSHRGKSAAVDGGHERGASAPGRDTTDFSGLRKLFGGDFPVDPTDTRQPPGFQSLRAAYARCVPSGARANRGGAGRLLRDARRINRVEVFDLGACRSLAELDRTDRDRLVAVLAKEKIADSWGNSAYVWPGIALVISTGASGVFVAEFTGEDYISVDNPKPSKERLASAIGGTDDQIFIPDELADRLRAVIDQVAGPQFVDDNMYGLDRWRYETAKLGRKDGIPFDATTLAAPSSPDTFWTSEARPVVVRLLSPPLREAGQSIFLVARIWLPLTCEYAGPVSEETRRDPGAPIAYRARIWHRHGGDCDRVDRNVDRVIAVPTHEPRSFRFLLTGSATATVEVKGPAPNVPPADRDRREGSRCRADADCETADVCVPDRSDAGGPGTCARICNQNIDCAGGRCDHDRGIVGVCAPDAARCDDRHPCPWGQSCRGKTCAWPTPLTAHVQGDCRSDGACRLGLMCLKDVATAEAAGRCRRLCTSSEMSCGGKHACREPSIHGTDDAVPLTADQRQHEDRERDHCVIPEGHRVGATEQRGEREQP
jgi:hypothetical protein